MAGEIYLSQDRHLSSVLARFPADCRQSRCERKSVLIEVERQLQPFPAAKRMGTFDPHPTSAVRGSGR
jgi:hypothetical protein